MEENYKKKTHTAAHTASIDPIAKLVSYSIFGLSFLNSFPSCCKVENLAIIFDTRKVLIEYNCNLGHLIVS